MGSVRAGCSAPHECDAKLLRPFGEHANRLYWLMRSTEVMPYVPGRAADWIILAGGLNKVDISTAGLGGGDEMCADIYEEQRGTAATRAATSLTRCLFLWGAVESLLKYSSPQSRVGSYLVSRLSDLRAEVAHHECVSKQFLDAVAGEGGDSANQVLRKLERIEGSIPRAGRLAYELRNELAHGSLLWPDDDDRSSVAVARQGDLAARVLILASQGLVAELLPSGLLFRDWSEDLEAVVDVDAWLYCQELHLPE